MAKISTPFGIGTGHGSQYNAADWLIGRPFTEDTDEMFKSHFDYEGAPEIDAGAYQLGNKYSDPYTQKADEQQRRNAAQMQGAQIATGPQGEMRSGQQDLIDMLGARARGEGQSIAEMQLQQGLQAGQAGAASLAASQAGVNPAMAARQAQMAQQQMGMQTNQQAAMLRAQEMENARAALGQQLGSVRGQDIGLATGQAGLDQSTAQANLQSEIQNQSQMDSMTQFYEEQGFARDQAELAAAQEQQRLEQERAKTQLEAEKARSASEEKASAGFVGAIGTALSAFSDVNAKECIKRSPESIDEFMNALAGYEYNYTDEAKSVNPEKTSEGTVISVMAQDLERTPLGKKMVEQRKEDKGFKSVNYGKGLGTMLASIARLNERLNDIEGDK